MEMIVYAALALIVLVVLAMVFSGQIRNSVKSYFEIGKGAEESAKGERCKSFFMSRVCSKETPKDEAGKYRYDEIPGDFSDCNATNGYTCYEKIIE